MLKIIKIEQNHARLPSWKLVCPAVQQKWMHRKAMKTCLQQPIILISNSLQKLTANENLFLTTPQNKKERSSNLF